MQPRLRQVMDSACNAALCFDAKWWRTRIVMDKRSLYNAARAPICCPPPSISVKSVLARLLQACSSTVHLLLAITLAVHCFRSLNGTFGLLQARIGKNIRPGMTAQIALMVQASRCYAPYLLICSLPTRAICRGYMTPCDAQRRDKARQLAAGSKHRGRQ